MRCSTHACSGTDQNRRLLLPKRCPFPCLPRRARRDPAGDVPGIPAVAGELRRTGLSSSAPQAAMELAGSAALPSAPWVAERNREVMAVKRVRFRSLMKSPEQFSSLRFPESQGKAGTARWI